MTKNLDFNCIFVDTNVLIGAYVNKKDDSMCLKYITSLKGKRLYCSSLSISQLVSVFQKNMPNSKIKKIVKEILHKFNVLSFSKSDIDNSLVENGKDLEDNIQYVICKKMKCAYFITNNKKDYSSYFDIYAILPSKVRIIEK